MDLMPAVFLGHGNPMNALEDNAWTRAWRKLPAALPRPRAILAVSAHWYLSYARVTPQERPRTIHDFGGFPRPLYEVDYPAPGDPELAARVVELLAPTQVLSDPSWGLDHGTWSLLVHLFPQADIPVVQLSIDERLTGTEHWALAERLRALRSEGVLILGSGNVVHNLHAYAWGRHPVDPFDWAVRFDEHVRASITDGRAGDLADYEDGRQDAALAVPTPEHFLPLLYILALRGGDEPVSFPVSGFDGGSISMLGVRVG